MSDGDNPVGLGLIIFVEDGAVGDGGCLAGELETVEGRRGKNLIGVGMVAAGDVDLGGSSETDTEVTLLVDRSLIVVGIHSVTERPVKPFTAVVEPVVCIQSFVAEDFSVLQTLSRCYNLGSTKIERQATTTGGSYCRR